MVVELSNEVKFSNNNKNSSSRFGSFEKYPIKTSGLFFGSNRIKTFPSAKLFFISSPINDHKSALTDKPIDNGLVN